MSYNSKRKGAEVEEALDKAMTALQSIPDDYATKKYVDDVVTSAIVTVLNTPI